MDNKNYIKEISIIDKSTEKVVNDFLNKIKAQDIKEKSFILNNEKWFLDYHPFDHSDDIIVEKSIVEKYDKFLLIKQGQNKVRIVGWTDKKTLMSVAPRDIYRNNTECYVVMDVNLNDLSFFKIEDKNLILKKEFVINQQEAENLGHFEMISGILAGLHYFTKKAKLYFKDLNQKDECIIGDKKIKVFTRDYLSDKNMLIPEKFYQKNKDIDIYILCKIKAGKYAYLGYIKKEVVAETRIVQMTGGEQMGTGEEIRRIFAEQYLNLSDFIKIFEKQNKEEEIIIKQNYVPLHVHSEWSIGDGFGKVDYIAETLRKKGFKACALTDHGTLAGVWEFQKACLFKDIKPIIGCEFYMDVFDEKKDRFHITILVKNNIGWNNILKLQEIAVLENFYYKPIIKINDLFKYKEGLIVLSGCSSGLFSSLIKENKIEEINNFIKKFKKEFKEDFYIEIQPQTIDGNQIIMEELYQLALCNNIKCVFTNDVHYPLKEDKKVHDAVKAINFKKKYGEAGYSDDCFYFMQEQDIEKRINNKCSWMKGLYKHFLEITNEISNKCNFLVKPGDEMDTLPKFLPSKEERKENLKQKVYEGLKLNTKYNLQDEKIKERLKLEVNRILSKDYENYFLIVADMIDWCKRNNIMVGPGRGSVGASLAALCLGITDCDPIEHNLLFDRFLSEIRRDAPDVDMDFQDDRRGEIFNYLINKYGKKHCAKIATYARFHPKGILKDIGRIFDIPIAEINKVSGLVIERSGGDARSSFALTDTFKEFEQAKEFQKKYPLACEIAMKLEGNIRHKSSHAAAMVVAEKELNNYAPINKIGGIICLEWEKQLIEDMKLIKFDILGLKTLSIIKDAIDTINIKLPKKFDDENVYNNIFKKNNTNGLFQLGTVGMQKFSSGLNISCFQDLYDATTLFRPSALHSGQASNYSAIKSGVKSLEYLHPVLENITKDTRGQILYQEQIMQIMNQIAGLSWATAEMARKVITKSKGKDAFNKMRQDFIIGAEKKSNIKKEEAEKLFDIVSTFGCLTGDTKIYRCSVNQYKNKELTIKEAFEYQKSENFKHRKLKILAMSADGFVRPHKIKKIHYMGKKPVFYLRTTSNKYIKATLEHRFLVNNEWKKLKDIKIGDLIRVTDLKLPNKIYGIGVGIGNYKSSPKFKKGKGKTNEEKNRKNKLIKKYKNYQICSSDKYIEMHHINKNHADNSKENIMLLCRKCHRKYENCSFKRFVKGYYTYYEEVAEIIYSSERNVYDIEMEDAPRNFIANNFISHNSYGFNKAHAVEYSIITYWEAWLKHYYPQAFFKALLKYEHDEKEIKKIMQDAENNGVKIEYPEINNSDFSFSIYNKNIIAGLNSIIGIGQKMAEKIIKNRPYESFEDFKKKCKVSKKILKGLIVTDVFRKFNINKKSLFYDDFFEDDFTEVEQAQLIYEYSSLFPKINISKSFDFGNFNFINIKDLKKYNNKFIFLRGIITDILKKDKILRQDNKHIHSFEKRLLYLNLTDDTGNVACQINPETFEKYSEFIADIKKVPVIVYGKVIAEGGRIMTDMIEPIDGKYIKNELREIFKQENFLADNESFIISARPAVSKNDNSYYRIKLSNDEEGLCFKFKEKLFPGMKVKYNIFQEPFINLEVIKT